MESSTTVATCKLLSMLIAPVFAKVGPVEMKTSPIFTLSVNVVKPVTADVLLTAMLVVLSFSVVLPSLKPHFLFVAVFIVKRMGWFLYISGVHFRFFICGDSPIELRLFLNGTLNFMG
jgi:hypothetical protein